MNFFILILDKISVVSLLELYDKNLYEEIRKYIMEKSTKLFVETHFCRNCLRYGVI